MGRCSCLVAILRLTPIWQLAIFPAEPVYWRLLNSDRVTALFEESGVVDEPRRDWLLRAQCFNGVPRGLQAHRVVDPRTDAQEVEQAIVGLARPRRIGARTRRDRFRALSLAVREDAERIRRERGTLRLARQLRPDAREVLRYPHGSRLAKLVGHGSL